MENMLVGARYGSSVIPGTMQADFGPLKELIARQVSALDGIGATDENLKAVKETLAFLRKFRAGMNARLKEDIARYSAPVEGYKASFADMMGSVDGCIQRFADQVDEIVGRQREAKRAVVQGIIDEALAGIPGEKAAFIGGCSWFFDESWTNKTASESAIRKEISRKVSDTCAAVELLDDKGRYAAYMLSQYKATGDLMGCLDLRRSLESQDREYGEAAEPDAGAGPSPDGKRGPDTGATPGDLVNLGGLYFYEVSMTVPEDFLEAVRRHVNDHGYGFTVLSKGVLV